MINAGAAYVVLGPVSGVRELVKADAILVGSPDDGAGVSVSDAGDVNKDGHDDMLIGAYLSDVAVGDAGAAYLVLGPVSGTVPLSKAAARFYGEEPFDEAGIGVAGAGDLDGDGRADLLIGAVFSSGGGYQAGAAYVMYGGSL